MSARLLSTAEAAQQLGISDSTLRNWAGYGRLVPAAVSPLRFDPKAVSALAADIAAGRSGHLRQRANRSARTGFAPPDRRGLTRLTALLREGLRPGGPGIRKRLYELAVAQCLKNGETDSVADACRGHFRRPVVTVLMEHWRRLFGETPPDVERLELLAAELERPGLPEFPGAAGMTVLSPFSHCVRYGRFFTPAPLIERLVADIPGTTGAILDPACGTGEFLLAAARRGLLPPEHLHGIEINPIAAHFARLNLLLCFPKCNVLPDIRTGDALKQHYREKFPLIIGNPPWGGRFDRQQVRHRFPGLRIEDSAAAFLALALELAAPDGRVELLLPEALFRVHRHRDTRTWLTRYGGETTATLLSESFPGVMSRAVHLQLRLCPDRPPRTTTINLSNNTVESPLAAHLKQLPCHTLRGHAVWGMGIVTGDNRRHLHSRPGPGLEPVWRGSGVQPFHFGEPAGYLHFDRTLFQQTAPEELYRAPEKLVYRFIGKHLIFARDTCGRLTLNSANFIISALPDISMLRLTAWFNSPFAELCRPTPGTLKVLRSELEQLPIPDFLATLPATFDQLLLQQERTGGLDEEIHDRLAMAAGLPGDWRNNLKTA